MPDKRKSLAFQKPPLSGIVVLPPFCHNRDFNEFTHFGVLGADGSPDFCAIILLTKRYLTMNHSIFTAKFSCHKTSLLFAFVLTILAQTACRKEYITNNNIYDSEYCPLEGRWLRIASNYSEYDGMLVEVSAEEKEGTIVVGPSTPDPQGVQVVGKVKWANILRASSDVFTMDDLNNDFLGAGRRSALMACLSQDTLQIAVKSNGSWQTWVRQ